MEVGNKDRPPPPLPPSRQYSVKFRKEQEERNPEKKPQPESEDIGFWTAARRQYMVIVKDYELKLLHKFNHLTK